MLHGALPSGPGRDTVLLHLTQSFNEILAYIANDADGAQTAEIVYLLEKARRSLSVLKLFQAKTGSADLEQGIQAVLSAVNGALAAVVKH